MSEADIKLARECAANGFPNSVWAKSTLSGKFDDDPEVQSALLAIKAERERTVAWLRERAAWYDKADDGFSSYSNIASALQDEANAIERGEHGE